MTQEMAIGSPVRHSRHTSFSFSTVRTTFDVHAGTSKNGTGTDRIAFSLEIHSRFRGIRSVPVPFFEVL